MPEREYLSSEYKSIAKEATRIQVCLVSAQPIPNLIPLRMEGLKPEKVILLVSPDMQLQAERLEKVIKGWATKVEKVQIAAYDLEAACETCKKILSHYKQHKIILNATGGTKIMAFAAFEVFRAGGKSIIYVDTQDGWVQWLSPQTQRIEFKGLLKVPTYLNAYGQIIKYERTDISVINQHLPIIIELVNISETYQDAIKTLNRYAAPYRNARTFPFEIAVKRQDWENTNFQQILELFEMHGILKYYNGLIQFSALEDIEFASGGWLEEYVFHTVKSINITDVRMGVEINLDTINPKLTMNEYDVIFTHNNRLFLIECKTKRFEGADRAGTNDEPIYKLKNLRDAAGGIYGKGMLVSYQRLTDVQKTRLSANRLAFCDGKDLKDLKNKILEWIG